jgi:hypothetical protein
MDFVAFVDSIPMFLMYGVCGALVLFVLWLIAGGWED